MFFENFSLEHIAVRDGTMRLRRGGSGPPLLLLHGNPQTHAMWHLVAPRLAERFAVVAPDLRGYGGSFKPPASADHAAYAKVNMARDMVELMEKLGHKRFLIASHDRGSRVAHRLAIDHPDRVEKLVVMDIVPTLVHFERADMDFGLGYYHWFWLAQPHPVPESLITPNAETWFRLHTGRDPSGKFQFHPDAITDYLAHVRNPETIRGICEDYRAASSIDLEHDRASRTAGRKITCPLLVLWGRKAKIEAWYDALAIWREYVSAPVGGGAVNSGHYLAEEAPEEVLHHLLAFLPS